MMFDWLIEHAVLALPEYVWVVLIVAGAVATVIGGLVARVLGPSGLTVKIVGIVAYTAGVFMLGSAGVAHIYQRQIKNIQDQIAQMIAKSDQVNTKVQTKIIVKREKIKEIKNENLAQIETNKVAIDSECVVPDVAIRLHNAASQGTISKDTE